MSSEDPRRALFSRHASAGAVAILAEAAVGLPLECIKIQCQVGPLITVPCLLMSQFWWRGTQMRQWRFSSNLYPFPDQNRFITCKSTRVTSWFRIPASHSRTSLQAPTMPRGNKVSLRYYWWSSCTARLALPWPYPKPIRPPSPVPNPSVSASISGWTPQIQWLGIYDDYVTIIGRKFKFVYLKWSSLKRGDRLRVMITFCTFCTFVLLWSR